MAMTMGAFAAAHRSCVPNRWTTAESVDGSKGQNPQERAETQAVPRDRRVPREGADHHEVPGQELPRPPLARPRPRPPEVPPGRGCRQGLRAQVPEAEGP